MSLLQDVLRAQQEDSSYIENSIRRAHRTQSYSDKDDSDDELVNVLSLPGTPDRTRPSSPVKNAASRLFRGPLLLSSSRRDPLKAFPTEVSQRIFANIPLKDLAKCALVSKKWSRSQTLNYVWFQHYRKENFHDDSLPPGKWTRRESKQNWRTVHLKAVRERSPPSSAPFSRTSGFSSPVRSGYQTPREIKEELWRQEAQSAFKPGKLEMREMYKELGGRKSKGKTKLGSSGIRDKGGWEDGSADWD